MVCIAVSDQFCYVRSNSIISHIVAFKKAHESGKFCLFAEVVVNFVNAFSGLRP